MKKSRDKGTKVFYSSRRMNNYLSSRSFQSAVSDRSASENSFSRVTLAATSGKTQLIWNIPNQYYIKRNKKPAACRFFSLRVFFSIQIFLTSRKMRLIYLTRTQCRSVWVRVFAINTHFSLHLLPRWGELSKGVSRVPIVRFRDLRGVLMLIFLWNPSK